MYLLYDIYSESWISCSKALSFSEARTKLRSVKQQRWRRDDWLLETVTVIDARVSESLDVFRGFLYRRISCRGRARNATSFLHVDRAVPSREMSAQPLLDLFDLSSKHSILIVNINIHHSAEELGRSSCIILMMEGRLKSFTLRSRIAILAPTGFTIAPMNICDASHCC
jgi:hypothetical protein